MKRQCIEWDKIFASYLSDKQVLYRKYELKNTKNEKIVLSINRQMNQTDSSQKEKYK
jgi:hypothetical protein